MAGVRWDMILVREEGATGMYKKLDKDWERGGGSCWAGFGQGGNLVDR